MSDSAGPEPRLRLLHVTHELSLTGAPRLALDLLRAIGDTIELRTVSGSAGGLEPAFRRLGPVQILNGVPWPWRHWQHPVEPMLAKGFGWIRAPAVGLVERHWRPDVVYVNSVAAITLVPRLGLGGFPTLVYVHELSAALDRLSDAHRRLLTTLPQRYLAVSEVAADELVHRRGIAKDRMSVVPPLMDVARIVAMANERSPSGVEDHHRTRYRVGGAGNPQWTKGIELWLLMARALVDRMGKDAVEFEWVGVRENNAGVEFRAMIEKLNLESSVRLIPETSNPYIRFRQFDVLAMTSWEESASLVVLESMALQVPVVSFAGSGGPHEQLGDTGVVIESFSPQAMAESIEALLGDPGHRADIGGRERARVALVNAPGRISSLLSVELARLAGRSVHE